MKHLQAMKGILRYVKGTMDYGVVYSRGRNEVAIIGYSYSDMAMDVNDRRSIGGVTFYVNWNLVTWTSQPPYRYTLPFYHGMYREWGDKSGVCLKQ